MSADSYTTPQRNNPEAINMLGIDTPDIGAYLVAQDFYLDTQKAENLIPSVQNLLGNIQPDQFQSLAEFIVKPIYQAGTTIMYDFQDWDTREHEDRLNKKAIPMGVVRIVQFAKAQELADRLFKKYFPDQESLMFPNCAGNNQLLAKEMEEMGIPNINTTGSVPELLSILLTKDEFLRGVADTVADKFPVSFSKSNRAATFSGMMGVNVSEEEKPHMVADYPEFLVETIKEILPDVMPEQERINRATFLVQKLAEFENPEHVKVFNNILGREPNIDERKGYTPITEPLIRQARVNDILMLLSSQ